MEGLKSQLVINSHEKLKGILYLLSDYSMLYFYTHYWESMHMSWKLIAQADKSEKFSIITLSEQLMSLMKLVYTKLNIKNEVKTFVNTFYIISP